jgi:hypothetical protein
VDPLPSVGPLVARDLLEHVGAQPRAQLRDPARHRADPGHAQFNHTTIIRDAR